MNAFFIEYVMYLKHSQDGAGSVLPCVIKISRQGRQSRSQAVEQLEVILTELYQKQNSYICWNLNKLSSFYSSIPSFPSVGLP